MSTNKRTFSVFIELEIPVVAEDEAQAEEIAGNAIADDGWVEYDIHVRPVYSDSAVSEEMRGAIPWGSDSDDVFADEMARQPAAPAERRPPTREEPLP